MDAGALYVITGIVSLAGLLAWRFVLRRTRKRVPDRGAIYPSIDAAADAPSSDQILFAAAQRLLDAHITSTDILDGRATAALGTGSTVLPVTIGLLNLVRSGQPLSQDTLYLVQIALVAYVLLLVSALIVFLIPNLSFRPNIETLKGYAALGYEGTALRRWVAEE